jgi:diguanylate cyclase (GGDEF)-like protein
MLGPQPEQTPADGQPGEGGGGKGAADGPVVLEDGSRIERSELLRLQLLRRVALEAVVGTLERCTLRALEPGDRLLARGQTPPAMYLVLSGRLSLHLEEDGEPVGFVEAGQTLGDGAALEDSPATTFVRAAAPTRLLVVREEAFWGLCWASHELTLNLLLGLSHRARAASAPPSEGVRQRRQLERDAFVDALTGCHSRRWLDDRLPRIVQRHARAAAPLALLLIDVDQCRRFNDEFGDVAGDCAISGVAKAVIGSIRPTDLAARYGGEELVVLLPGTAPEGAGVAAERVRARVARTGVVGPDARVLPPVTVSIGIASLPPAEGAATLLAQAQRALARAKAGGRNRVEHA